MAEASPSAARCMACPHVLAPDVATADTSFLSPRQWSCQRCGTTNSVWACLHCSHVGCGTDDEGHAHLHFDLSQHPIVLEINHKTLHCYSCGRDLSPDHAPQPIRAAMAQLASASSQQVHMPSVVAKQQKEEDRVEDLTHTADAYRRSALVARCFTAWVHFVAMARKTAKSQEGGDAPSCGSQDLPPPPPPPLRKKITPGITGLRNLGNTCYMNAILQALSHIPFFREYMRSLGTAHWPLDETDQGSPLCEADRRRQLFIRQTTIECFQHISRRPHKAGSTSNSSEQGSLCNELYELIRVMWSGKWAVVTPGTLLNTLWQAVPSFHGYCQQDAQEFLWYGRHLFQQTEVLDRLQAELECLPHIPLVVNNNKQYCIMPQKLLSFLFEGSLSSRVVCGGCGHVSTKEEPFQDLSLDFPLQYHSSSSLRRASFRGKSLSLRLCQLTDLLKQFTQPEEIPEYACDCCCRQQDGTLPSAKRTLSVMSLPDVLRLHIKRFRWVDGSYSKIMQHIKFPFELNMKPYVTASGNHDDQECVYDLSSVVVHLGSSLTSGHYISHCWNPVAESWILCNDSRMSLSSAQEVELAQAYILLYVRRHGCSGLAMGYRAPLSPSTPVPPSPLQQYSLAFQRKRSPITAVISIPKLKCKV